MLLILNKQAKLEDVKGLVKKLSWMGFVAHISGEEGDYSIAVVQGVDSSISLEQFQQLPFVTKVTEFEYPFKLAAKEFHQLPTVIDVKGVEIGGGIFQMMAGPCSIESKDQIDSCAAAIAEQNVKILRGGAFKPRTSPYSFQGLGEIGLKYMREAADKYNLIMITEVMDGDQIKLIEEYADIMQVGARNMQNFTLLKKLGKVKCPIFLKRGLAATYRDLLMSAEYIMAMGNPHVMLGERGIRSFETFCRNTLDLNAVPILKRLSHLPVIVDPSHGTGIRWMVPPMARAGIAAGSDGMMIEIHPDPEKAVSDKEQTITFETFAKIMDSLRIIGPSVNMKVP